MIAKNIKAPIQKLKKKNIKFDLLSLCSKYCLFASNANLPNPKISEAKKPIIATKFSIPKQYKANKALSSKYVKFNKEKEKMRKEIIKDLKDIVLLKITLKSQEVKVLSSLEGQSQILSHLKPLILQEVNQEIYAFGLVLAILELFPSLKSDYKGLNDLEVEIEEFQELKKEVQSYLEMLHHYNNFLKSL